MRIKLEVYKEKYEEELKQELDNVQSNMRMKMEVLKEEYVKELEQERDNMHKDMRMKLELVKEEYEKELNREKDLSEKNLRMGLELSRKDYEKELEQSEKTLRMELDLDLECYKENYEKKLKGERDLFEQKLCLVERGNNDIVKELRRGFEKEKIELEAKIEVLERKLSVVETEKSELDEMLKRELEEKIEMLEGLNRDLEKKREFHNEKLALVEERRTILKGGFATVNSGDAVAKWGSRNESGGVSNLKSCSTKTHASLCNPSSKPPPQHESTDLEGIINGDQLGVKTHGSFFEYEPEAGSSSENSINYKRKRSIDGSEDDTDSLGVNKNTKHLVESGCKKISLPSDFLKKLNPAAPGVSKANPPPKLSSASIEQYEDNIERHEISELHLTKSISSAVDGTNRFSRTDRHVPSSPAKKAVAGPESGKEIKWEHRADMLSAFGSDPELCMAAVCALHRRTISAGIGGFSSYDILSGTNAAKYLSNGDPAHKLSKSVSEVQQDRPDILKTCQTLAFQYGDQLFEIYQKKLDTLFCSKT